MYDILFSSVLFDYKVGDLVLILNTANFKGKLEPSTLPDGPWKIVQVHTNGTVSILRNHYVERMNIRRLRPLTPRHNSWGQNDIYQTG